MLEPKIIKVIPVKTDTGIPRAQLSVDGHLIPLSAVTVFSSRACETDMTRVRVQLESYRKFLNATAEERERREKNKD